MSKHIEWVVIFVIAFFGGIISNIVVPERRGLLGYFGAGLISVFCGGVAGLCSHVGELPFWLVILVTAVVGVNSNTLLTYLLVTRHQRRFTSISVNGGVNRFIDGTSFDYNGPANVQIGDDNTQHNKGVIDERR